MHTCTVCFQDGHMHPENCYCGAKHWPSLCCPGCDCRSYEETHAVEKVVVSDVPMPSKENK